MSEDTQTPAAAPAIADVEISAEEEAAVAAALEPPTPAAQAEPEGPPPERVTTLLRLACGHVFGTDVPVATAHHCEVHDLTFPVVSAHEAPRA